MIGLDKGRRPTVGRSFTRRLPPFSAMSEPNRNNGSTTARGRSDIGPTLLALFTIILLSLYFAALTGWLRPVSDLTMIARLEPFLFLIFGFYLGRIPLRERDRGRRKANEDLLRKLEVALLQKDQANLERVVVEEKIRNARIALQSEVSSPARDDDECGRNASPRAIATAINILNS